jgi:hypothetical protein
MGGSGTSRCARSRRFEWYKLESGSGSIGRVVSRTKSGSGRVAVVPNDSQDQGGSNGTGCNVAVAVLAEL